MSSAESSALPYLTSDLPGISGVLKSTIEDFQVEEIPLYDPCGEGEHLFLWIEKRGLSPEQLTRHIARQLGMNSNDVGMAGLKDRIAITRQYVSVPASFAGKIGHLDNQAIRVLRSARHGNKLKTGHLRGNRFQIVLRDVEKNALQTAREIRNRLQRTGFPNYYGDQRFGRDGETLSLGMQLLRGEKKPGSIPYSRRRFLLRLALCSVQSQLFNMALAERIQSGKIETVLSGDVMEVIASGGKFVVEDVEREQARFHQRETVPTGPIFGLKMISPTGSVLEQEARLLAAMDLKPEMFQAFHKLLPGTRRPYLIWVDDCDIQPHPAGLSLSFTLPSGVYATTFLREFQKSAVLPEENSPSPG